MGVLSSIFEGAFNLRADASGAPAPWDNFWYGPAGGTHSSSGMRVSPETAKRLAVIFACVSVRQRQLASIPFKIYTDLASGGKRVVDNHPLYDLLYHQPNQWQTAYEFKEMMQGHLELRGNAYAEKIPGPRGPVDQLIPLHPDRIKVDVLTGSGRIRYTYQDPLLGHDRVILQEEMFHLRSNPDVLAVGQSRISVGLDSIGLALGIQDYRARSMKNDGQAGWVISGANFKTREEEELFRRRWQEGQTGANRGKTAVLPPGLTVQALGLKPVDAQLIESARLSQLEMCTLMGMLPHRIGVDAGKSATYASVEQFNIMDAVQSVLPMVLIWEQAIQRDLLTTTRYYAKGSLASMLRGDTASRYAAYHTAILDGWMSQDDVRELEDMNPIPGGVGRNYWRPVNVMLLSQTANPLQASKPSKAADDPTENDDQGAEEGTGSAPAAHRAQLQLLATDAADRCVRREVSGLRKLVERSAGSYEITEFYAEQIRFIAGVFKNTLNADTELKVRIACETRAQYLIELLADKDDEFHAAAQVWIDNVAATEPVKLAALAVEGVK